MNIDDIEPFLGRLLLEVEKDSAEQHLKDQYAKSGVSREFLDKFELPETVKQKNTQIHKGKIIKKAPDAFGQAFRDRYGDDMRSPVIGDVVYFIENESYPLDPNKVFHLIGDCDIVAYRRGEQSE